MELITDYYYQRYNVRFYLENGVWWFDAGQISFALGYCSENAIRFEVNMGSRQTLSDPAKTKEVVLPGDREKTLMISEHGIQCLQEKYNNSDYLNFMEWIQDKNRNSIQLKSAQVKER
jgi:prophage antirepressor-like protein